MLWRRRGIEVKTPEQVRAMRSAGLVVGRTLEVLRAATVPGVTLAELDALAERTISDAGATPSFLGYQGFPATICTSVNDVVVHGIPDDTVVAEGDLVSVDCGAVVDGWHGDAAITVPVGRVTAAERALVAAAEAAMWAGIAAARPGARVGDVSAAVEASLRAAGHDGIVRDYTGHGIGTALHQAPDVPNVGRAGRGPRLTVGMVLAIEPMVTLGTDEVDVDADEWTVRTLDGSRAAHSEHTVALTEAGPWVLTSLDGGREALAGLGVEAVALDYGDA
ncbi:type I methionyl aminopeptidase [Nocardioides sp. CFH 31398]|uniref:type I methionyl aminopeptidase n=1 Tax=Nocardioides sp. CFH 31398 TaxID=2919579 RepID=UPI001F063F47|nr:type I methionyl aminopeptidase [Nocardioides sp. CFH 31398]MCH1868899.1 type I methionyl aminopeptidase [Nocardioides sp. CFH 31398]